MSELDEIRRVFARYIGHVNLMTGDKQFILSKFMGNAELDFIDTHIPYVYNSAFEADLMELLKKHNINNLEGHISFSDEVDLQKNTSRSNTIEVEFTGTIS